MGAPHLSLALLAALVQSPAGGGPAAAVRQALAAVAGDSASVVEQRLSRALERNPADRLARLRLATLAHLTYRDTLAERLYRDLLPTPGTAPRDAVGAHAALGLARLAALRDRWPSADTAVTLALGAARALRDSSLLAETLIQRARIELRTTKGPAIALATVADARAVLPAGELRLHALASCVTAEARVASGDTRAAIVAAREGSVLAERAGATRARARCEFVLATTHATIAAVDSARAAYERAITAYRDSRDAAGLAYALSQRGDYVRLLGSLGHARRDLREALVHARAAGAWGTAARAHVTLAQIAHAAGDVNELVFRASRIRRLVELSSDPFVRVMAPTFESRAALAVGDVARARAAIEQAVRAANAAGQAIQEAGALHSLAWIALLEGDSAGAFAAMNASRNLMRYRPGLRGHGNPLAFIEGTLALRWGDPADAERIFRERLASTRSRGVRPYTDAARLAEVLVRMGRLDEAEREILLATEQLDAWRRSIDDRRLRLLAFQLSADRADPDLGVATVVAALASDGRLASAFEVVERGRARNLTDRLTRALALDTTSDRGLVRDSPPIRLDSLRRALPDDFTALLEYVTGRGDPTTLFVITRRDARAYVLAPHDSLAPRVARLKVLLESGEDPRALGRELGRTLLAPALADLDPAVRRLVVVPDGPLHRLPFDALVLPDGRFAVERFTIASAPSAGVVARLWERRSAAPPAGLVVLADPDFAAGAESGAADAEDFRSALAGTGSLPRLRGSAREARVVARYTPDATVRRRGDASEAWLERTPLGGYGVVHFATHALVDEGSIANTALALSPGEGEDGFVRPGELAELELAAELVVLSACRTAGGVLVRGEGVQGLAAPLLVAGARAVAATWWPIGDAATVRLVDDFYRAMADGAPAGDALRLAKLAALGRGAPAREWAAFTIVGDPLALPLLRTPAPGRGSTALLAGAALALILLGYGLAMRRRRASERG